MTRPAVLGLGLLLILAGCGGKERPPEGTGGFGVLEGLVLDETEHVVEGAAVRVLLTELATTTDAQGRFRFDAVTAGPVRVLASKEGYVTDTVDGVVTRGASTELRFRLVVADVPDPYNRTIPFTGRLFCGLPQGTDCGSQVPTANSTHLFAVDSGLEGMVVELKWSPPASGVGRELAFDVLAASPSACGSKYAGAAGVSVLRLTVTSGHPVTGGHQCVIVRPGNDTVSVDMPYELSVTLFYHAPPPAGFAAVRDNPTR